MRCAVGQRKGGTGSVAVIKTPRPKQVEEGLLLTYVCGHGDRRLRQLVILCLCQEAEENERCHSDPSFYPSMDPSP